MPDITTIIQTLSIITTGDGGVVLAGSIWAGTRE
jgi:hypothetical protein